MSPEELEEYQQVRTISHDIQQLLSDKHISHHVGYFALATSIVGVVEDVLVARAAVKMQATLENAFIELNGCSTPLTN
jgi:hypothetical protein